MRNHPGSNYYSISPKIPPVVGELEAIFRELPDEKLLEKLQGPHRRGRPGYSPVILWRCYVAYYYLGLESVSALIRLIHDNPYIAMACGIESPDQIPSQPTFSRFGTKLAGRWLTVAVKDVLRSLTRRLYDTLPDFGKSVAIDSTDIKAWSNSNKKGKRLVKRGNRRVKGQKPKIGVVSDPDAGWIVKKNTSGKTKYVWGYKVHILCDTTYELPLVVKVTAGNVADVTQASPLLSQARFTTGRF